MNRQPYDSLRLKLALPFALLGFLVSGLLSATAYFLVADMEHRNVVRMLRFEADSYRYRRQANPLAVLPNTAVMSGYTLPAADFADLAVPPAGEPEVFPYRHADMDYIVYVGHADRQPFALLFDIQGTERVLTDLMWLLAVGVLMMTGLSALIGSQLADPVIRPINALLGKLASQSIRGGRSAAPPESFASADLPKDEIGHLMHALDAFTARLYGFALRESYFAADASHELRTPTAIIRGAAEVLLEDDTLSPAARARLDIIHRQAVRMTGLLEALLLLAREDGTTMHADLATSMPDVIAEAIGDIVPVLRDRPVAVRSEIHARTLLPVERALADVVVSNLLRNAAAHTRTGEIVVRLYEDHLEVEDSGVGIPEDRFPEIFHRYAKGADSAGSGLGLSIVARLLQALGWHIDITSRQGEGTRVRIHFHATP